MLEAGGEETQGGEVGVEAVEAGGKLDEGGALGGEEVGDCGVCKRCLWGGGEQAVQVAHLLHEGVLEGAGRVGAEERSAVGVPEGDGGVERVGCCGVCEHGRAGWRGEIEKTQKRRVRKDVFSGW
jgi:hypothetical protein